MKKKKMILSFFIIMFITIILSNKSYGAIAVKPVSHSQAYTNRTISQFFDECLQMKDNMGGLDGTSVFPHMATSLEYETVAMFTASSYGKNDTDGKYFGTSHYDYLDGPNPYSITTTGNRSGIFNFGYNTSATNRITYLSALWTYGSNQSYAKDTAKSLYDLINKNPSNLKYYITISDSYPQPLELKFKEESIMNYNFIKSFQHPVTYIKNGVLICGYGDNTLGAGLASGSATCRPTIWNYVP